MVSLVGIEPTRLAAMDFKSIVYYQFHQRDILYRLKLVRGTGLEPVRTFVLPVPKTGAYYQTRQPRIKLLYLFVVFTLKLVRVVGFEPTIPFGR